MKARRTTPSMKSFRPAKLISTLARRLNWRKAGWVGIYIIEPRLDHRLIYGNSSVIRCRIGMTSATPNKQSDAPGVSRNARQWMLGFRPAKPIVIWVKNKIAAQAIMRRLERVLGQDEKEILASWYPKSAAQMHRLIMFAATLEDLPTYTTADVRKGL